MLGIFSWKAITIALSIHEGNFSKNPEFPYEDYERFDFNAMEDTECKAEFRFTKKEIPR